MAEQLKDCLIVRKQSISIKTLSVNGFCGDIPLWIWNTSDWIVHKKDFYSDERTEKHAQWAEEFIKKYDAITEENVSEIVEKEVGIVFEQVLCHAGVFKRNEQGNIYFDRFMQSLNL